MKKCCENCKHYRGEAKIGHHDYCKILRLFVVEEQTLTNLHNPSINPSTLKIKRPDFIFCYEWSLDKENWIEGKIDEDEDKGYYRR